MARPRFTGVHHLRPSLGDPRAVQPRFRLYFFSPGLQELLAALSSARSLSLISRLDLIS
ncbi:hypothetical protein DCAR_0830937 [Daucus carota subsp. sativus]|uniref:Uncharacterized protein n=1 Tax=Daucus carota subsp. sativus TaxID=79200 RepID=A0A175YAE1_DAUCS|nr:hypothetical protein DCAR_0830937 [Daucus carota subsp. sativus]